MPFKKGLSGNPNGRPKGKGNKTTEQLRETIHQLIDDNMEQISKDLKAIEPKERVKLIIDLLQYALPKLANTKTTIEQPTGNNLTIVADTQEDAEEIEEMLKQLEEEA